MGVGLSQGTILGSLLAGCYLTKLDRFMEETFTLNTVDKSYAKNYRRHEENWIQWNLERGKKIHCNYYRYADDTFITCHNEIHFLGFKIVKSGHSVWILINNYKEYAAGLKQFKFNTNAKCQEFMKWFRGVLNYFDIVNKYYYGNGQRELLNSRESDKAIGATFQYLWSLWTRQKGADAITKRPPNPLNMEVHHVMTLSKGSTNNPEKLILVSSKTHYLIHHGRYLDKRFEKYLKHLK